MVNGVETRLKDIKILVVTCSSKVVVVLVKFMELVIDKLATVSSTCGLRFNSWVVLNLWYPLSVISEHSSTRRFGFQKS